MWIRAVATLIAATGLISCGATKDRENHVVASPPATSVDDMSAHPGEFCPKVLPRATQETYGFGSLQPAAAVPTLAVPEKAWLCRYAPRDIAPKGSNGAWYEWVREVPPRRLDTAELTDFSAAIKDLRPPPPSSFVCTDDLGPRYLVSYADRDDLTGVVIDDYGCEEVRLTDDPFTTVPGDPAQAGIEGGFLAGPTGLLAKLNAGL